MLPRRTFLKQASTGVAGLLGMPFLGLSHNLHQSADALLERWLGGTFDVRALAQRALDTAKAAGAQYADVRFNVSRRLNVRFSVGVLAIDGTAYNSVKPEVETSVAFGVRAVINSSWGFAGESVLTPEVVDRTAQLAVLYAKDGHHIDGTNWDYASAPVVKEGHWETPIEVDPFTVPLGQIVQIYREGMDEVMKVKGARISLDGAPGFDKSERLFASTEGSVITQKIFTAYPAVDVTAVDQSDPRKWATVNADFPYGMVSQYGYEALSIVDLKTAWPKAAEEAVRKSKLPYKQGEIGRYDVVLGNLFTAALLGPTSAALELDRALGLKANNEGTTFAMPPEDMLGKYQLGNEQITITGDRSQPHALGTVGWDEEGVKPDDFTLVENGVVMDYITTRATAPKLADWYAKQGKPVRSHGCATRTGRLQPTLHPPNLTLKPGRDNATLDDLIKEVKRGYYFEGGGPYADQQQLNIMSIGVPVYEIVNGELGMRVRGLGLQFSLPKFWQGIVALGGESTTKRERINVDGYDLDRHPMVSVWTVPALVKGLNVVNTAR